MRYETWYILDDGTNADPSEVAADDKGVLRHKNGVAVAIGGHGNPKSRSVDVDEEKKLAAAKNPAAKDRQVKAGKEDDSADYKTR